MKDNKIKVCKLKMNEHSLAMNRKEHISTTALKLIVENGLYDASIGKIAKEANIPVGSVYTYFASKEELINDIFREVKNEMGRYIFEPVSENISEKEELNIYWQRAVEFGLAHKQKFFFAEQFINSPLIQNSNTEERKEQFEKVFALLERGIKQNIVKKMDVLILHNIIYTNIVGTIKYFAQTDTTITYELFNQLFECCWDSIKR
jgi:TetR/AcrR family transcriptional regulator, repressor of fatR-cypB operon